jgi:hypothetical protein
VILNEACRTIDLLDSLQAAIDRDGPLQRWGEGARAILLQTSGPSCCRRVAPAPHRASEVLASLGIPADD